MKELVNAVEDGVCVAGEPQRWWNHPRFRLVPLLNRRPGDRWNPPRFNFDWLGFAVWSKDTPDVHISVRLDDQALRFRLEPPYLHVEWAVPLFPYRWHQKLWRKTWDRMETYE